MASPPQQGDSGTKPAKVERESKIKPDICYRYNRGGHPLQPEVPLSAQVCTVWWQAPKCRVHERSC